MPLVAVGEVCVDGTSTRALSPSWLRSNMGLVNQVGQRSQVTVTGMSHSTCSSLLFHISRMRLISENKTFNILFYSIVIVHI